MGGRRVQNGGIVYFIGSSEKATGTLGRGFGKHRQRQGPEWGFCIPHCLSRKDILGPWEALEHQGGALGGIDGGRVQNGGVVYLIGSLEKTYWSSGERLWEA